MSVQYRVISTVKPGSSDKSDLIHFPRLCKSTPVGLKEISNMLAKRSTASAGDLQLVVEELISLIPELVSDGKTVTLGDLGTFKLHAKTEPSDKLENVNVKNIKGYRLSFTPSSVIRKQLKGIKAEKAK